MDATKPQAGVAKRMLAEMAAEHQRATRLMAEGLVGQATITEVRETGTSVNQNPVVEFDLHILLDGRDPYPVTHRQVVSRLVVGTFAPGAVVPVRVDPGNVAEVMIA
jgi:hypothetical protein